MRALAPDDPRVIGEYRLRARLGAGGMGRVYLGLSPAGRAVAIKVVNPDLAGDAEFLHRFAQEVAAARAVSGIYTAPVVASGLNEHPPWLATAFVPGPSLDQVVSEHGPLPEPALWPLLAGLTEALAAIHACGVVHRDLKPANVLLATDGPRVIDFGISRATDGTALTAAGVVFGTPGYMSPEQAEGKPAGPASDMFALGCVIAYAAGGRRAVRHRDRGRGALPRGARRGGPGPGAARAAGDRLPVPGQGPGRPAGARGAGRRARRAGPWHRAVGGGVLAAAGGRGARRLSGPAGAGGRGAGRAARGGVLAGRRHASGDRGGVAQPGAGSPGAQAYPGPPGPQGYPVHGNTLRLRAIPRPRGTAGRVRPATPPPAGELPAAVQAAGRAALAPLPGSMRNAIGLMYAGAGVHAGLRGRRGDRGQRHHRQAPAGDRGPNGPGRITLGGVAALAVVAALIEVAAWLGIARACRNGRGGARITGTVLFGLHTIGLLGVLANTHPGLGLAKMRRRCRAG